MADETTPEPEIADGTEAVAGPQCTQAAFCACLSAAQTPAQREACFTNWSIKCPTLPFPDCPGLTEEEKTRMTATVRSLA